MEIDQLVISRRELIQLIERNGGVARGLNLSGKRFSVDDDYSKLNLQGIILDNTKLAECNLKEVDFIGATLKDANLERVHLEGASLFEANMEGVDLVGAHLEGADLSFTNLNKSYLMYAHLEGANLSATKLREADLMSAHLQGANFQVEFTPDIRLGSIDWGNFKLSNEKQENQNAYKWAIDEYRELKVWYTRAGYYDVAGKFFYREMEVRRKAQGWKKEPLSKLWSWTMRLLCGYGERPERVGVSAAVVIFGLALAYFLLGSFISSSFLDTLYYSVVSFVALGYGSWAPQPIGWAKYMGAIEAVLGVFMMALFLVTFTRKMTR